jgi:hypothetical protein
MVIDVEMPYVQFSFEGSRSRLGLEWTYAIPSESSAKSFGLRECPGTLDLNMLDGTVASMTFRAPIGWKGSVTYIREDLMTEFAKERKFVMIAWGERDLKFGWKEAPEWLQEIRMSRLNQWCRVFA